MQDVPAGHTPPALQLCMQNVSPAWDVTHGPWVHSDRHGRQGAQAAPLLAGQIWPALPTGTMQSGVSQQATLKKGW